MPLQAPLLLEADSLFLMLIVVVFLLFFPPVLAWILVEWQSIFLNLVWFFFPFLPIFSNNISTLDGNCCMLKRLKKPLAAVRRKFKGLFFWRFAFTFWWLSRKLQTGCIQQLECCSTSGETQPSVHFPFIGRVAGLR